MILGGGLRRGFDDRVEDLPDCILKYTAQISEGRDIAALDWHYADDIRVRSPVGINRGSAAGKANSMAPLTEIPDRELFGEDGIGAEMRRSDGHLCKPSGSAFEARSAGP